MTEEIMNAISSEVYGVWFLIGAALVFWMQAGFAMVEAGFTRAKNTGNIIMKNLMDFCIGTVMFILIGFGLFLGEDVAGIFGKPGFDIFTNYANFDWSNFVFNLVFCATTATIVSGAMAERTKFLSYCVYSAVISAVIYPIEAHWTWGGGWLSKMGFHDFAGSNCIHMVGGICALIGAAILGPRIGKFKKQKDGSIKVGAFPGHNLALGALGVFILWFCWFGFNGCSTVSATGDDTLTSMGNIFITTNMAAATATVATMLITWFRYGKPDVSMTLNGSLAGLVAITAGCDLVSPVGAFFIGLIAAFVVTFGIEFIDKVLKIDDPVGAVGVHGVNGFLGTLCVGLFSTGQNGVGKGLFYGGGFTQLGLQLLGFVSVAAWAAVCMVIVFTVIKATIGLRASKEEEIRGLDIMEHGLSSAYAGFEFGGMDFVDGDVDVIGSESMEASVPALVKTSDAGDGKKITKVEILMKQERFERFKKAMNDIGVTGMTVTQVLGCGTQKGAPEYYRGVPMDIQLLPKTQVEMVISSVPVMDVINATRKALYTGHIGDGKIFVYDVEDVVKVRTGESGYDALQGEDD